jgi:hypothetical protein
MLFLRFGYLRLERRQLPLPLKTRFGGFLFNQLDISNKSTGRAKRKTWHF